MWYLKKFVILFFSLVQQPETEVAMGRGWCQA